MCVCVCVCVCAKRENEREGEKLMWRAPFISFGKESERPGE